MDQFTADHSSWCWNKKPHLLPHMDGFHNPSLIQVDLTDKTGTERRLEKRWREGCVLCKLNMASSSDKDLGKEQKRCHLPFHPIDMSGGWAGLSPQTLIYIPASPDEQLKGQGSGTPMPTMLSRHKLQLHTLSLQSSMQHSVTTPLALA